MSGLNKVFAWLGACLAIIVVMRLIPQQTVVIKPDRTWHLLPKNAQQQARTAARQNSGSAALPAGNMADGIKEAAPANAVKADAVSISQPVATPDAAAAPESLKAQPPAQSAEPAPLIAASAGTESAPLAGAVDGTGEQVAATDPWAPIVTRADEVPAATQPVPPNPYAALSTKPETATAEAGIPDSDPRIAPILAAHPDRDLILCLAGCGKGISVVEVRRRSQVLAAVTAEMIPASASLQATGSSGDVVCIAGCDGKPGVVVFKNVRLSWISDEGSTQVKQALRAIADRIVTNEGLDMQAFPKTWVSDLARGWLLGEDAPAEPFSFAGPRVAGWMARVPVAALQD